MEVSETLHALRESLGTKWSQGDTAYLLSNKWFFRLKRAARQGIAFSRPIDNNHLLKDGCVKDILHIPQDMVIVPEPMWKSLVSKYGGGPEIPIPCLENSEHKIVPVPIPITFTVYYLHDSKELRLPGLKTVADLKIAACDAFKITDRHTMKLLYYDDMRVGSPLDETQKIIDCCRLRGQLLFLEDEAERKKLTMPGKRREERSHTGPPGGFLNGMFDNLCYVNATVQCLMNLQKVVDFATRYHGDNEICNQFKKITERYWNSRFRGSSWTLREFRKAMGAKFKEFSRGTQCDAHEFLVSLIDQLLDHKDNAEHTEMSQFRGDGKNDAEKAKEFWNWTLQHADPENFQTLYGMLGNKKVCEKCQATDSFFESFVSVLVQVPLKIQVSAIPYDMNADVSKLKLTLDHFGISEIKARIESTLEQKTEYLLAKSNDGGIAPISDSDFSVREVFAFAVPDATKKYVVVCPKKENCDPFLCEVDGTDEEAVKSAISSRIQGTFRVEFSDLQVHPEIPYLYGPSLSIECDSDSVWKQFERESKDPVSSGQSDYSVIDGLKGYFEQIVLKSDCCEGAKANLQKSIWILPEVLILHLSRFNPLGKNAEFVAFDDELDMTSFVVDAKRSLYRLRGFVCHMGTLVSGHYFACVRYRDTDKWFCCNDQTITPVDSDMLGKYKRQAYLIFYERT